MSHKQGAKQWVEPKQGTIPGTGSILWGYE